MSHKQSEIRTVLPVPKNGLKIIDGQSFKARTTDPLESGTTGKGGGGGVLRKSANLINL